VKMDETSIKICKISKIFTKIFSRIFTSISSISREATYFNILLAGFISSRVLRSPAENSDSSTSLNHIFIHHISLKYSQSNG